MMMDTMMDGALEKILEHAMANNAYVTSQSTRGLAWRSAIGGSLGAIAKAAPRWIALAQASALR